MTTETEILTSTLIRGLRDDAANAGDLTMVHACEVALGTQEPVTTEADFEDRYGGAGFSRDERDDVLSIVDETIARQACADAINSARAQHDEGDFVRVTA